MIDDPPPNAQRQYKMQTNDILETLLSYNRLQRSSIIHHPVLNQAKDL